jgi:hypothetical protein
MWKFKLEKLLVLSLPDQLFSRKPSAECAAAPGETQLQPTLARTRAHKCKRNGSLSLSLDANMLKNVIYVLSALTALVDWLTGDSTPNLWRVAAAGAGNGLSVPAGSFYWEHPAGVQRAAFGPTAGFVTDQVGQTAPNYMYAAPTNPANFSNGVGGGYLADGLKIPFTPKLTGNVQVFAAVDFFNPNSDQSTYGQIWYGTGTAPGFGAALPAGGAAVSPGRGNPHGSGSLFAVLTGLTVGTPYWFDLGHGVQNGGVSGSHNNISYIIIEI